MFTFVYFVAVQHERGPRKPKNKVGSGGDHHHGPHHHPHQLSPVTGGPMRNIPTPHSTPAIMPMMGTMSMDTPIDLRVQGPAPKVESLAMPAMQPTGITFMLAMIRYTGRKQKGL